jgi:hypothetical protein
MSKSSKNFSLTLMQPRFFQKVVAVGGVDQEMFGGAFAGDGQRDVGAGRADGPDPAKGAGEVGDPLAAEAARVDGTGAPAGFRYPTRTPISLPAWPLRATSRQRRDRTKV